MSADYFERRCNNCAHFFKEISDEPCYKCSHMLDKWEPITPIILINCAKLIKKMCTEFDCVNCPFYNQGAKPECSLAPRDDYNTPSTWEV